MPKLAVRCLELNLQEKTNFFGRFALAEVNESQALTIGTALRRILLTEIPGLAISGVRIATINHEFSTLPGVREDVLELLLNLKEIIFKTNQNLISDTIGRLKVYGPAVVTASALNLTSDITICNPTQYIATIADNSVLEMEVKIDTGVGYLLSESQIVENSQPVDFMALDAAFSPVRKVNYEIDMENNQLIINIQTNGSITPTKALSQAIFSLVSWLWPIQSLKNVDN